MSGCLRLFPICCELLELFEKPMFENGTLPFDRLGMMDFALDDELILMAVWS